MYYSVLQQSRSVLQIAGGSGLGSGLAGLGVVGLVVLLIGLLFLVGLIVSGSFRTFVFRTVQLDSYRRVFRDLKAYYRGETSYPQDRKSILITYAIGGFLTVAVLLSVLFPPLIVFGFIVIPILFGYYVRELGWVIHAEQNDTLVQDPFPGDRPAFGDLGTMAVDGIKFAGIILLFGVCIAAAGYLTTAVLDIGLAFSDAVIGGAIVAGLTGLVGLYVVPAFLCRYADEGTFAGAVEEPAEFLAPVSTDAVYFREVVLGTLVVGLSVALVASVGYLSPLLVPVVGFPVLFIGSLQGLDHYARGYSAALNVTYDDRRSLPDDAYALPLREGGVVTPDRDRSILVLGETGSGKTEAIKLLAHQFSRDPDAPFLAFDYKDDYKEFFGERAVSADGGTSGDSEYPDDLIVLSLDDSTHIWNIFEEVDDEAEFEEIARTLFSGEVERANNPYFPRAAQQVLIALLKTIDRRKKRPTNKTLVDTFEERSREELYQLINEQNDLRSVAANLDPESGEQSNGVYGHLQTMMSEVFKGDFREAGEFSIREYMRDPDGKTLILDFPLDRGESVRPVYRLYIDWALRQGLIDKDQDGYFILDEFQTIPGLSRLERLVNAGRARNAYAILGLQSRSQLNNTYGEDEASSILSGLSQEILLRAGDQSSVEYVRSRLGRTQRKRLVQGPTSWMGQQLTGRRATFNQVTTEEEYALSESEIQRFDPGEGVIVQPGGWRVGSLYMLEEVKPALDQWRNRHSAGDTDTADEGAEGAVTAVEPDPENE
jgi:hypothetical protein